MIEKIDRIAIAVNNLDEATEFFTDLLGIEFDDPSGAGNIGMRGAYSSSGLELIEPTSPDTVIGKFVQQRGEGLWAIVFKVKNLDEAVEKFKKKGMRVAGEVKVGDLREVAFHPKNAYGVEIVLAEYPEKHPATVAAESGE